MTPDNASSALRQSAPAQTQLVQLRGEVSEQFRVGGGGEVLELIRVGLHVVELALAVRILDVEVLHRP